MRSLTMLQIHLINTILEWERRLEIEDERRKVLRLEPYRELPTDFESLEIEQESASVRVSRLDKKTQPENSCCAQMQYREI
jgi:hypothetical protein